MYSGDEFHRLFQSADGRIGRREWMPAAAALAFALLIATLGWMALSPYAHRDLGQRAFIDPVTIGVYVYLLAYAVVVMLVTISWVNLGAKRFRDRGLEPSVGLAGVLPLAALLAGAMHWLQPQIDDAMPRWIVILGDAALLAVFCWTMAECADLFSRKAP